MLALALPRRLAALGVLVASLGTLGWLWFGESDEQRIVSALHELAHTVSAHQGETLVFRTARLNGAFKEALAPDVTLDAPELKRARGTRELAELAAAAPRLYGDFEVELSDLEVVIDQSSKQARASARATLIGAEGADARRETRNVTFHLASSSGSWRVHGIQVAPRADE